MCLCSSIGPLNRQNYLHEIQTKITFEDLFLVEKMTVFVLNHIQMKRKTNWANDKPYRVISTKFNQFKYIFHHKMIEAQDFRLETITAWFC